MKSLHLAAVVLAGAAAVGVPAAAAFADPPTCSKVNMGISTNGSGKLFGNGQGNCSQQHYRVLEFEIKQDLDFRPDPVALKGSDAGSKMYYLAAAEGCDNNNDATYYGRVFYDGYTDYVDSPHKKLHVC